MNSNKGTIFLLFGASASGKTQISKELCNMIDELVTIVYYTTRSRRENEREGVDYYFVSKTKFELLKRNGKFKYTYTCHGNHYGIPKEVDYLVAMGRSVILGISRKLMSRVYEDFTNVKCIYLDVTREDGFSRMLIRDSQIAIDEFTARLKQLDDIKEWAKKNIDQIDVIIESNMPLKIVICKLEKYIIEVIEDDYWKK